MPAEEFRNKRFFPFDVFGHGHAQPCLAAPCPNVLTIDELREGQIWSCAKCLAKHEFYAEVSGKDGMWLRYGVVRLLAGDHIRSKGEPRITEFVE